MRAVALLPIAPGRTAMVDPAIALADFEVRVRVEVERALRRHDVG